MGTLLGRRRVWLRREQMLQKAAESAHVGDRVDGLKVVVRRPLYPCGLRPTQGNTRGFKAGGKSGPAQPSPAQPNPAQSSPVERGGERGRARLRKRRKKSRQGKAS